MITTEVKRFVRRVFLASGRVSIAPVIEHIIMMGRDYRALRDAARMTQSKWADALGVSQSLVSRWESSDGPPPSDGLVTRMREMSPPLDPTEQRFAEILQRMDEMTIQLEAHSIQLERLVTGK